MAAYNFPNSPSDGDTVTSNGITYTYSSSKTRWDGAAPSGSSTTVYATIDLLPLSGASTGDQAYVSGNNRLYIWNGTGWYNIALINTTPSISGASSSYALATDGTATTVTITATDPEGIPITYSIASDTSGNVATVTQGTGANTNVFTITPTTNTANAGTFSLTFRASDGVNIATAVSEFTLVFSIENSNYTTALITSVGANNAVNNSFTDSSSNSHTITANGNVTQNTFSPYRHGGYSTYFDGNGDYLTVPDDASLEMGSSDFTVEIWVYCTGDVGTWQTLIGKGASGIYSPFTLYRNSNGDGYLLASTNGSSWGINSSFGSLLENTWYHIALVRSGDTWTVYKNGASSLSATLSGTAYNNTTALGIGSRADNSEAFKGYLTDIRVVKGTAVYTSTFTPPTERLTAITNTSLLTCHLPYIADGSTNDHTITVNGNTKTEPFSPYEHDDGYSASSNGGSMYFDGSGDGLSVPNHTSFDIGSGDFTIETWFYSSNPDAGYLFGKGNGQSATGTSFWASGGSGSGLYLFYGSSFVTMATGALPVNQWTHLAFVRNGTNFSTYINGKSVHSTTASITVNTTTNVLQMGDYPPTDWVGFQSDFRFVKGTAVYTSAFTPPTAPLTAITNTSLLLNGTDAGIIDKSQSVKTITLNGDVKSSTTQSKYLTSSMYFDGTGDYLELSRGQDLDIFNLGTSDFTVEMWLFPTDLSNSGTIISFIRANNTSDDNHPHIYRAASELRFYTDGTDKISGGTLSLSTWHHVAISRSGNDHKMFLDGSQVGSTYTASNTYTQGRPVVASYNDTLTTVGSANLFTGYMSDVRLTKGLARYTSNFTPPSAALQG